MRRVLMVCALALAAAVRAEEPSARTGAVRDTSWMRGSVGLSFHWTAGLPCEDGAKVSFEEAVNGFDVDRFVSTLDAVGARHLIFTTAHGLQFLPMPNAALDAIAPGRTSKRDLFGEILDACGRKGIRVIAYYNHSCNGASPEVVKWMRQCGCPRTPDGRGDEARFQTNVCAIVRDISLRYGRKISAWWFDSAYSVDTRGPIITFGGRGMLRRGKDKIDLAPVEFPWQRLLDAARSGNPVAPVAINSGVGNRFQYCDDTDYYAGEAVSFDQSYVPEADGRRVDTRWITLDDVKWTYSRARGFLPFRKSVPELQAYVREHVRAGHMVTFNVLIDRRGKINPAVFALKDVLNAR